MREPGELGNRCLQSKSVESALLHAPSPAVQQIGHLLYPDQMGNSLVQLTLRSKTLKKRDTRLLAVQGVSRKNPVGGEAFAYMWLAKRMA